MLDVAMLMIFVIIILKVEQSYKFRVDTSWYKVKIVCNTRSEVTLLGSTLYMICKVTPPMWERIKQAVAKLMEFWNLLNVNVKYVAFISSFSTGKDKKRLLQTQLFRKYSPVRIFSSS